jgi:endonuclease/exonuclease/phosphatase family metal-dependent hydrolase
VKPARQVLLIIVAVVSVCSHAFALNIHTGDHIQLKATNPAGVPLHRESKPSMFARLPDKSVVTVLQTTHGNWLRVSHDGLTGWIVKRYIAKIVQAAPGGGTVSTGKIDTRDVWQSPGMCRSVVASGARLPRKIPGTIRLVTWNIRWFPVGTLSGNDHAKYTDRAWLSCVLAWLNADIIAVEEVLDYPGARSAMKHVLDGLHDLSGGNWKIDLQHCGLAHSQHVGIIYNADKVTLSGEKDLWQFNGKADSASDSPCKGSLRPGRYAYVKSRTPGGFDFNLIVVHADSGRQQRDLADRNRALDRLNKVSKFLLPKDRDIVIVGDFNTMGTELEPAQVELAHFKAKVASEAPGFRDITIQPRCTEYYDGRGGWLDHVLVTAGTRELASQVARVSGYCRMANCDRLSDMPSAYDVLSDHCPVVIDFLDKDMD